MNLHNAALFILFITAITACKKNKVELLEDHSSKYVVYGEGYRWTYQMDSIHYSGFEGSTPDTFQYWIQDVITDSYLNGGGDTTYSVERWYKTDSVTPWKFARTYSISTSESTVMRSDFDQNVVILSLPILLYKTWDSNQFNTGSEVDAYYDQTHVPAQVGPYLFDSTCLVLHEEQINAINSFYFTERYAANFGLVQRQEERIQYKDQPDQAGFKYTLRLIRFEKE